MRIIRHSASSGSATTPHLAFTVEPTDTPVTTLAVQPVVTLVGDTGTITGFTGNVAITMGNNPNGAALTGTTTKAATSGVATFTNLALDVDEDSVTFKASAAGLADVFSTAFNVRTPQTPFWYDSTYDRRLLVTVQNTTGFELQDRVLDVTMPGGVTPDANSLRAVEVTSIGTIDRAYDWRYIQATGGMANRFDDLPVYISGSTVTLKTQGRWFTNETRYFHLYWKAAGGISAKDWSHMDSIAPTWTAAITRGVTGDIYSLVVGGTTYSYTQQAGDSTATLVATGIRALINGGVVATGGGAAATININAVNQRTLNFTVTLGGTTTTPANTVITKPLFWQTGRTGPDTELNTPSTYTYGVPYSIGGTVGLTPGWGRANTRLVRTMQYKVNGDGTQYGALDGTITTQTRNGPTLSLAGSITFTTRSAAVDWLGTWTTTQRHVYRVGRKSDSVPFAATITAGTAGDTYAIVIDGNTYSYPMVGGDTATVIASALVTAINGGTFAQASSLAGVVSIFPYGSGNTVTNTGTTVPANVYLQAPWTVTITAGSTSDVYNVLISGEIYTYTQIGGDTATSIATALKNLINAGTLATATSSGGVLSITTATTFGVVTNTGSTTVGNLVISTSTASQIKHVDVARVVLTYTCQRAYTPPALAVTTTVSSTNLHLLALGSTNNNFTSNVTENAANQITNFSAPLSTGKITSFGASADLSALPVVGTILGTTGNTNGVGVLVNSASLIGFPWTGTIVAGATNDLYTINVVSAGGNHTYTYTQVGGNTATNIAAGLVTLINAGALATAVSVGAVLTVTPTVVTDATFTMTTTGTTTPANLPLLPVTLHWAATSNPFPVLQGVGTSSGANIPANATVNLDFWIVDGFTNNGTTIGDNLLPDEVTKLLRSISSVPAISTASVADTLYSTSVETLQTMKKASDNVLAGVQWYHTNGPIISSTAGNYSFRYDIRSHAIQVSDDDDATYSLANGLHGLCLRYLRTGDPTMVPIIEKQVQYFLDIEAAAIAQYDPSHTTHFWDGSVPFWYWPSKTPSPIHLASGAYESDGGITSAPNNLVDPLYNSGGGAGLSKGFIQYTQGQVRRSSSIDQLHHMGHGLYAYLYLLRNDALILSNTTLRTNALAYLDRMVVFEAAHWLSQDRWIDNLASIIHGTASPHSNGISSTQINTESATALANPYWGDVYGTWNVSNTDGAVINSSANLAIDYFFRAMLSPDSVAAGVKRFMQGQAMDMLVQSLGAHQVLDTNATWGIVPSAYPVGWQGRANSTGNITRYNVGHTPDKHWLELGSGWRDTLFGRVGQRLAVLCLMAMLDPTYLIPTENNGVSITRTITVLDAADALARTMAQYQPDGSTKANRYASPGVLGGNNSTQMIDGNATNYWMFGVEMWHLLQAVRKGTTTFSAYYNPRGLAGF